MKLTGENLKGVSGVYAAIHRESNRCYVGSSVNIWKRLNEHIRKSLSNPTTAFHKAIATLGADSFDFEVLCRCEQSELLNSERFYIALLNACSVDGFNTLSKPFAPNYGRSPSLTTRARLSAAVKGTKRSDETKRKMSAAKAGIATRKRGFHHSEETKSKMALAHKGRVCGPLSDEHRIKLSVANRGKVFTNEHRAKLSDAAKRREEILRRQRQNACQGVGN